MKTVNKFIINNAKKIIAYVLSLALIFSLGACTSAATQGAESAAPQEESISGAEATDTAEAADTAEQALFKESGDKTDYIPSSDIKVHYIDVGQGDAAFIELPNKQTMLIDAGNSTDGEKIAGYIRSLGYGKIDFVVATHPHADHIGGMAEVISSFDIGKMYMPRAVHTSKTFENLLDTIESCNIDLHTAKSGVSMLSEGGLAADILSPVYESYDDINNYSAVVRIRFGETVFLFMGDAEREAEESILGSGIDADVLKVGHHGSSTSSSKAFIDAATPTLAVISCGKGNSYGHPHAETIAVLEGCGAQIYRTDESGTITVTADDKKNITAEKKASPLKENAPPAGEAEYENASGEEKEGAVSPSGGQSDTVYITNTGSKYHKDGCSYLKKSKNAVTREYATGKGLEPCSRCKP